MKLCLDLVSSHNLKKTTGWHDLQLCTPSYIVLRNTSSDEKRCIHYISTESKKFVYKASQSIASLIDSMICTSSTQSGLKFVGVLSSGTIFTFDFLKELFWCSSSVFRPIADNRPKIIHLAADNEAQSVLIVTAALNVYFIQLKTREQCRDNFAYTSISPESESYSVSSCFYEEQEASCRCIVLVFQPVRDAIVVNKVSVFATQSKIEISQRRWQIDTHDCSPTSQIHSCISLNANYFAVCALSSKQIGSVLHIGSIQGEKLGNTLKTLSDQNRPKSARTHSLAALQFSADSSLLLVLTKEGNLCAFTIFGQQLSLDCSQLSADAQMYLHVLSLPASNSGLSSKQKFLIRTHSGLDDLFVITDGFYASIFRFNILDKSLSLSAAIFDSLFIETEDLLQSLEASIKVASPRKDSKRPRARSTAVSENAMRIARSFSVGNNNSSIPDLVAAYENYLGNIGSNDTIMSRRNASTLSLNRVSSYQSLQDDDSQLINLLNAALMQLSQMYGYFELKAETVSPYEYDRILSNNNARANCNDNEKVLASVRKMIELLCIVAKTNDYLAGQFDFKREMVLHFLISRLVANILFVALFTPNANKVVPYCLLTNISMNVCQVYSSTEKSFGNKLQMRLLSNAINQQIEKAQVVPLNGVKCKVSVNGSRAADLKNQYLAAFTFLKDVASKVQREQTMDYLLFSQKTLTKAGIEPKYLHDSAEPDSIARKMVETTIPYKQRIGCITKEYQKRGIKTDSELNSEDKLGNSTLSMLYFFLENYDIKNVLQLIDNCVSCYFAPEDTLVPVKNMPELLMTDNLKKFPISFVNLVANDKGNMKYIPVLFSISASQSRPKLGHSTEDEFTIVQNRTSALRSVARFLGRYFLANQKLFVYPSHRAIELQSLLDENAEKSFEGRKVFLARLKIASAIKKWRLSSLVSPQLALSLMFVCGLFTEAAKFCQLMGNNRLSIAVLCAAYKLNDNRAYQLADPRENVLKLTQEFQKLFDSQAFLMSLTQTDQIVRAMKELGDLFQLGIVCGVDVMPALVDDLTSRVLLSASSFNLFIPENISLPSLPLFMPPSATDQSESEEDLVRRTLQQLMYVLRVSMQAANCDQFLVKHYLLKVQKKLTKTKQTLPEVLVSRVSSAVDVSLLDEKQYTPLTRCLRSTLFVMWMTHCRDQFNQAIRTYNQNYTALVNDRSPDDTGVFDDAIWDSWEAAIHWANFLLPFAKFMGEEIALIDCLISLFMQMPVNERSVRVMATVFHQPKRVEPRASLMLEETEDSFVFDSSLFALSHADYDLTSNQIVPFILEKKYKKLMLRLNCQTDLPAGEVFTLFVNKQRAKRSYMIKNGLIVADLFFNQTDFPEIGQLEFELTPEYLSFLETCVDIMLANDTNRSNSGKTQVNVPVLIPYAKQVEKHLGAEKGGENGAPGEVLDDLMVPNMRHYLQSAVCTRAIKRTLKQRGKNDDEDKDSLSLQISKSFADTLALTEMSFSDAKKLGGKSTIPMEQEMFKKFNTIEEHFATISQKEQISYSITLSGKVFYSEHIDKSWSCLNWLCDWVTRDNTSSSLTASTRPSGFQKLDVSPNLLANASWNYLVSWNGWPERLSEQLYVVMPVNAQYYIERLGVETGGERDDSRGRTNGTNPNHSNNMKRNEFENAHDSSLPSVTQSIESSPRGSRAPGSAFHEKYNAAGEQHQLSEGLISDAEHQILQSIDQPELRETALDARLDELRRHNPQLLLQSPDSGRNNKSMMSNHQPIMVDADTLRKLIRSETAQALNGAMDNTYASQSPRKSHQARRHGNSVEFNLSSEAPSYNFEDEADFGRPRGKKSHKKHGRKSKKDRRSNFSEQQNPSGQFEFYQQQVHPQSIGIPLLNVNTNLQPQHGYHHGFLEPDPYYMNSSFYHHGSMPAFGYQPPMNRGSPFLLQPNSNDENQLTNEQLVNILPSRDELEKFHEHRKMQLLNAQNRGRQQRLAWVTAGSETVNEMSPRDGGLLIPTEDEVKVKLLHAELQDEKNENEVKRPETPKVKEVKVEEALVPQAKSERTLEETPRTPRPILKDHHASTTEPHEHVKFKHSMGVQVNKSVTVVSPYDGEVEEDTVLDDEDKEITDEFNNLSFEVEEDPKMQDATTSPLPSPKKARKETETQTAVHEKQPPIPRALTVEQIKRGETSQGHASNRAAIPPEIFVNLHFPHVHKKDFLSVVDIEEKNMEGLPEITSSLYDSESMQPRSYADLHWQIVRELREGPKPSSDAQSRTPRDAGKSPRFGTPRGETNDQRQEVYTTEMATSPFVTPRKTPRDTDEEDDSKENTGGDRFTEKVFAEMDLQKHSKEDSSALTRGVLTQQKVTPRTRGKTVNDQLNTMAEQLQVMEETSKRLMHEFTGTHYLMDKVDGMMDVLDPESKDLNKQRPSTRVTPGNEGKQKPDEAADIDDKHATLDLGSLAASNADDNNELEFTNVDATLDLDLLHSEEKSVVGQGHENNSQQEFIRQHNPPPQVSKLDLRGLSTRENQSASKLVQEAKEKAKKQEVRKWMKEKRKERLGKYIEKRKDLAQKEHQPWTQKHHNHHSVTTHEIKENLKMRENMKAERDAEFTEKRYQLAEELLGEIATDRPTTSRHEKLPPPSVLSTRRGMASGASTNRSRNESRLPVPANKTLPSKSRSRSPSQDPPAGYSSWYEYYRLQANHKLAARRRVAEEIRQEREQEESELMSRLDELSQLSEHSHPNYNGPAGEQGTMQGGEETAREEADQDKRKAQASKPPPKPFTALVKIQNPDKTRNRSSSPGKTITHHDRVKQAQSTGPLPKPSVSPARNTPNANAPNALRATRKTEKKPRVAKTYAERLQELQRDKSPMVRTGSPSPVRAGRPLLKTKTPRGSPMTYTQQLQKLGGRQISPATQTSNFGSTFKRTGSPANKTYQRSASHRDRPYASPYREATDKEVISGRARRIPDGKRTAHDDDDDRFGGDDMSEMSDISAWSVPTKVKQLLQMDNDAGPVSRNGGVGSHATSDSPRLTNIDFSELEDMDMESQISSKLDWDAVQQMIQ